MKEIKQAYRVDGNYLEIFERIGVEKSAYPILLSKTKSNCFLLRSVKSSWANIIKQEMIASGGDAAINKDSYSCSVCETDILLMGTQKVYNKFINKMKKQPECFLPVIDMVSRFVNVRDCKLKISGFEYDLSKDFLIIGILNVTPDSFSDGGRYNSLDNALRHTEYLINSGAGLIDIGGESSRPGSRLIGEEEEMERVMPVIEAVKKEFSIPVSVDSYKPNVIKSALSLGVSLVNDISNGDAVCECIDTINKYNASVLVMMNQSKNSVTGSLPSRDVSDPLEMFVDFIDITGKKFFDSGLSDDRVIFDPGIGFGLSDSGIIRILTNTSSFVNLYPKLCYGISRKSCLGRITGLNVNDRDPVSNSLSMFLMTQGVKIFRTHDPKGLRDVIMLFKAIKDGSLSD